MTRMALMLIAALTWPVAGQAQTECPSFAPGCERLPRLLDELTQELAPLLDSLTARLDPFMRALTDSLGDLSGWHAPEVLPNGDILIRRRLPPPDAPDQPSPPVPSDDDAAVEPFEL
jgi:hypothetical protein